MIYRIFSLWNKFWFQEQSPAPVAIFRILLGLFVLQMSFNELAPNFLCFFGVHGLVDTATMAAHWWQNQPIFDAFLFLPQTDFYRWAFFATFVLFTFFLTIGFCTRVSALLVFLGLLTLHRQCPFILDGGDDFMRFAVFFIMLSPAGDMYSFDRFLAVRKNKTPVPVSSPWAQRMLQLQISIAYFYAFLWKIVGIHWQQGVAVYYASHLIDFGRFQLPWLVDYSPGYQALTYYTLFVEFAMGCLVWFKPIRYWVLLSGVILHAGIDLTMNLPCFEWLFVSSYIVFVEPADLEKVISRLKIILEKFTSYVSHYLKIFSGILDQTADFLIRLRLPLQLKVQKESEPIIVLGLLIVILAIGSWVGYSARTRFINYERRYAYENRLFKAQNHWTLCLNRAASLPDTDEQKLSAEEALAMVFSLVPNYPEAAALLRHVCKERTDQNETYNTKLVRALSALAGIYVETGHLNAAELCYRTILNYDRSHLNNAEARLVIDWNNLGVLYYFRGLEAENRSEQAINFAQAKFFFTESLNRLHHCKKLEKSQQSELSSINESDILLNQYLILRDSNDLPEARKIKQEAARLSSSQGKLTMP